MDMDDPFDKLKHALRSPPNPPPPEPEVQVPSNDGEEEPEKQEIARDELGRWKPGQSGNPGGAPKGQVSLVRLLREALKKEDPDDPAQTVADKLIEAGIAYARAGDPTFWKEILNRIDGKVPDHIMHQNIEEEWNPEYEIVNDPAALVGEEDEE